MVIICVDDSKLGASSLQRRARSIVPDAQIYKFTDPESALQQAKVVGCDLLLTEIEVGYSATSGIMLAKYMKEVNPAVNIIFVTVCSEYEHETWLNHIAYDGYLTKPVLDVELANEICNLRCMAG